MKLTVDQVRHIAKLARIKLSDQEVEKFSNQLTNVLSYIEILDELNIEGAPPTSQVTGLSNVLQEDKIGDFGLDPDKLLKCTKLPVKARQILVKNVFQRQERQKA